MPWHDVAGRGAGPRPEVRYAVEVRGGEVVFHVLAPTTAGALLAEAGMSRGQLARAAGAQRLRAADGAVLQAGSRLDAGAELRLVPELDAPVAAGSGPALTPAAVLHEDPFLLVADKPAGILVHADGTAPGQDTLTSRVEAYLSAQGRPARVQAVQRLDVQTTGCVAFSLMPEFQAGLDALVAGHDMDKWYLAVVRGGMPAGPTRVDRPIGRDRHDARRMRVSPSGREAHSVVWCLARSHDRSLVLVRLLTGRRHQIRVHLASLGHPVVGDALYDPVLYRPRGAAGPRGRAAQPALMLHCWREGFRHPVTGGRIEVEAPWPRRFDECFDAAEALGRARSIVAQA